MRLFLIRRLCIGIVLVVCQLPLLADITGKSRSEIIAAFGEPTSALSSSSREILNYAHGQVILKEGLVHSFTGSFSTSESPTKKTTVETESKPVVRAPAPKPTPPPSTEPPAERRSIQPFRWSHTLAEAQARSVKEDRPILALFTGPDWCGPCQQLEADVLNTAEFKRLGRKRYIPLKVALYRNTYQTPQAKAEYNRLSSEFNIRGVPSFVILDAEGNLISKPDLTKRYEGVTNYQEHVFAAIEEAESDSGGLGLFTKLAIGTVIAGIGLFMLGGRDLTTTL